MTPNSLAMICACGKEYILGRSGTIEGCDECQHILRNNIDHTILLDEDELTDMEKA